jgi:hypothetical protein
MDTPAASDNESKRPDLSKYIKLIDDFVGNRTSANEFEVSYLSTLESEARGLAVPIFDVLQRLFGDADS